MAQELSITKKQIIMDTKLIRQYGEEILCYRMRTARQKKRMQYEDFDKQLIQLDKRETTLRRQIRTLGFKELHPPVQKGWIRHYVLRDDVARSEQAEFFENILKKINTYEYHWRKDFKVKRKRNGKKIYIVTEQHLLKLRDYRFWQLDFTDAEREFFTEEWYFDFRTGFYKQIVFTEPWRFELKIRANMIYKEPLRDGQVDSEKKWIANYLERNDLRGRQAKLLQGNWKSWSTNKELEKHNEINLFKNKSLYEILDFIQCEK